MKWFAGKKKEEEEEEEEEEKKGEREEGHARAQPPPIFKSSVSFASCRSSNGCQHDHGSDKARRKAG